LPWRTAQTVDHIEECSRPLVVDQYHLVKTELFGGGIIRVEFKLVEIGQKAVNAQSREVELAILFGGG
jgi:hypothetical protein